MRFKFDSISEQFEVSTPIQFIDYNSDRYSCLMFNVFGFIINLIGSKNERYLDIFMPSTDDYENRRCAER